MNVQDEVWGEARLIPTIEGCNGLSSKEILNHVFIADTFVAGAQQHEDMTLVVSRAK